LPGDALQILFGHRQNFDTCIIQLADVARRNATPTLHDQLVARHNVEGRHIALQALGHRVMVAECPLHPAGRSGLVEHLKDFFES
jgi:hypothetical protein